MELQEQTKWTVGTELGPLFIAISEPNKGFASFVPEDITINRIVYKATNMEWSFHPERDRVFISTTWVRRLDKHYPDDGPTDGARRKIEATIEKAVKSILSETADIEGTARRQAMTNIVSELEHKRDRALDDAQRLQKEAAAHSENIARLVAGIERDRAEPATERAARLAAARERGKAEGEAQSIGKDWSALYALEKESTQVTEAIRRQPGGDYLRAEELEFHWARMKAIRAAQDVVTAAERARR